VKRRLLYLVTEDWYFCSHRLGLARAAQQSGYEVHVVTQVARHGGAIEEAGLELHAIRFARSARRPVQDMKTLYAVARIYRSVKPELVHHVAMKPILYGSIAASLWSVPRVVNAYTGLGFMFSSRRYTARALRAMVTRIGRPVINHARCWSIVQNADDRLTLARAGLIDESRSFLIRGSGVDVNAFTPAPESDGLPVVMLAARLLWDKGIGEFIAAARRLRAEGVKARFVLVGDPDPENPMSVAEEIVRAWAQERCIEWWGHVEPMPEVLRQAHLVCLPSYREGLPKVLLEAAACGRALIATDTPGCREVVRHGENGLLVPVHDVDALAAAIADLLSDAPRRRAMGKKGRAIVEREFSIERVVSETLEAYRVITETAPGGALQ